MIGKGTRLAVAIGAAALAAGALAQEPAGAPLQFSAPRRLATVVGNAVAELEVNPPAGTTVVSIELSVDGTAAGTKASPPWTFPWSAGDGTKGHRLDAVARFSDGTSAHASVTTSRLAINETEEVALVNVYAIARDAKGGYVGDLAAGELTVLENGRKQDVDRFSSERLPLRIAIVLDTSLSMEGDKLESAVASAVEFLGILQPGDEGLVVAFSDEVRILEDLTSSRAALEKAIRGVQAQGGTALYDAIFKASNRLVEFDGRRVLVVLSDGKDEAANGLEPGSLHTLEEAQERVLRNEVMVFAIGLGRDIAKDAKQLRDNPTAEAKEMDFYGRKPLVSILQGLADTTGGTAVFSPGAGQLRKSFTQVAEDLRHQYRLAYRSDDTRHDGAWREIKVTVARPGVTVTNKKGYYAPSDLPLPRKSTKLRP